VPEIITPSMYGDYQQLGEVAEVEQQAPPFLELGTTGLKRAAGYVDEEFLPQLKGRKGIQIFREMGDNDPIAGALLFTFTQLLRGLDWPVVPGGKGPEHTKAAKLVETAMEDMSTSWDSVISEILSCLQYGWSWHEIVYKRRSGLWQSDGRHRSKYDDGLIGWRKMPIRSQETLLRWVFDDSGDVRAMVQLAPPDYQTRIVPISRSLLFRFGHHKGNPEGRSVLRNSYRPWYYKKRMEEFESVGVERDLAGLPKVGVPSDYLKASPQSEQGKMVEAMKKMVRSVRRNEQEGVVFPLAYDEDTKQPMFTFDLMTSGGSRSFDTNALITRYEQRQLMTVLADFIMVGHDGSTGTYNLHVDKTGIFRDALDATAQMIADVFNRHAIPRLFMVNGWKPDALPTIQPGHVDAPDLSQLSQFLTSTAGLGFSWGPDVEMERYLRNAAGLPQLEESEQASHRRLARMDEAARLAEEQVRLLTARSELAQAMATEQALAAGEPTPDMQAQQQQMAQGQQTMDHAQAGEERQASDHRFAQAQQLFQAIGPQGSQQNQQGGANGSSGGRPKRPSR
jgi:hypothetical protein